MPIYARAGAIIPLDPVRQYTAQPVTGPTTLQVYPGADGAFTLYDDDGQSLGYGNGSDSQMMWIRIRWHDTTHRLTLQPDPRMKHWPGGTRVFTAHVIGSGAEPKRIEFHGATVETQL
jgi:alpha-glucosidase